LVLISIFNPNFDFGFGYKNLEQKLQWFQFWFHNLRFQVPHPKHEEDQQFENTQTFNSMKKKMITNFRIFQTNQKMRIFLNSKLHKMFQVSRPKTKQTMVQK